MIKENFRKKYIGYLIGSIFIFLIIFMQAKMVGLCASSSPSDSYASVDSFPIPYGYLGFGTGDFSISENTCYGIFLDGSRRFSNWEYHLLLFNESFDDRIRVMLAGMNGPKANLSTSLNPYDSILTFNTAVRVFYDVYPDGSFSYVSSGTSSLAYECNLRTSCVVLTDGSYALPMHTIIPNYPLYGLWGNNPEDVPAYYPNSSGTLFQPFTSVFLPPGAEDYWVDFVDGFVDDSIPLFDGVEDIIDSSTSSVTLWQSLLSWLYKINKNIIAISSNIINNLNSLLEPLFDNVIIGVTNLLNPLNWIKAELGALRDFLEETFGIDFSPGSGLTVQDIGTALSNFFGSFFTNFWTNFVTNMQGLSENIYDHLPNNLKNIIKLFNYFYNLGLKNGEFDLKTFLEAFEVEEKSAVTGAWNTGYTASGIPTLLSSAGTLRDDINDTMRNIPVYDRLEWEVPMAHIWVPIVGSSTVGENVGLGGGIDNPNRHILRINFDWYETIRPYVYNLFFPFLYCQFALLFLKSLPGVIKGNSGAVSAISKE